MSEVMGYIIPKPLSATWTEVQRRMKMVGYKQSTIVANRSVIEHLTTFMGANGFALYSPTVGELYLNSNESLSAGPLKATIQHLNLALSDVFWGEHYSTKQYEISNNHLKELFFRITEDDDMAGIAESTRRFSNRCIKLLDIYMREENLSTYSQKVGEAFLQSIRKASNHPASFFSQAFRYPISRLDRYCVGEKFFIRRGNGYVFHNKDLRDSLDSLIESLSTENYKNLSYYETVICKLDRYMFDKGISIYAPQVGSDFLENYGNNDSTINSYSAIAHAETIIARLNDAITENTFYRRHSKIVRIDSMMPEEFQNSFHLYLEECKSIGNTQRTCRHKATSCTKFFIELKNLGVSSIDEITPDVVIEATSVLNINDFGRVRGYLHFCAMYDLIKNDFSLLIPTPKKSVLIPPYYTKEERQRLEAAPDRETPIGKRDYAIILIANRLGMRSSDIVGLSFNEIQKGKRTIDFEQFKTKIPHSLPLLTEIEEAVEDYANNGRPNSESDLVFLRSRAPFYPLCSEAIHAIVSKNFLLAGVDISMKKHGAHALRASLGTDLVNNGFTYDETRHVLGQDNADSTRHYAVIDINNLRNCAQKPHSASGNFKRLLKLEQEVKQ